MEAFAILFEQGCGKSKVAVDTAAYLYQMGRINAVVIIAPNDVHRKWLEEDFPFSFPDYLQYKGAVWANSEKDSLKRCEALMEPGTELKVLCMNVEAFSHAKGVAFLKRFLLATDAMIVVDESSRIKNPDAIRTKNLCSLTNKAKYRRILTGIPVSNSPFDYYGQFMFLDPEIFGCSYFAFKAEYAELLDADSVLMRKIMENSKARRPPAIVAKDSKGRPMYRNLDKMKAIIAPYSMRVNKEDVLPELPSKIYTKRFYKLEGAQLTSYNTLAKKMRIEFEDHTVTVLHKMVLYMRLQQIICGYIPADDGELVQLFPKPTDNPRIKLLLNALEDIDGQVIIWARFAEDIRQIAKVLGDEAVTYYGGTNDRVVSLNEFRSGKKKYLIGNPVVGGIGLNLVNSSTVVYYSNTFSYEDRKQSEDRVHRIGQKADSVLYIDLIAEGTMDEKLIASLLSKEDLAVFMTQIGDWSV